MKQYILTAIILLGMAISANSQNWAGKGNTVAAGDYYLYNVKSGKYLTWGTNYGTRATLVQQAGELVTLTASGSGYKMTFAGITKTDKGVFLNGSNNPFCDGTAAEFTFTETSSGSKVYTISTNGRYLACRSDFSAEPSPLETVDDASSDCATWMLIKRQDRIDALADATAENPIDATFFISGAEINENFDNAGAWDGTDPTFGGRTGNLEATGLAAENYWGANVESFQTLTELPAGKYRLSCYGFYRDGSATDAGTKYANGTEDIKAYLFAGSNRTQLSSIMVGANNSNGDGGAEASSGKWVPDNMAQAVLFFFRGRYPAVTVDAIVGDDGNLRVGISKDAGTEQKWTIWDRFRLTYYGDDLTSYAEVLEAAVTAANDFIATHTVPTAAENAISDVVTEKNKEYATKADYMSATQAINDVVAQYNTDELKNAYANYYAFKTKIEMLKNGQSSSTELTTFNNAITTATTAVEAATTAAAIDAQTANLRSAGLTYISSVEGQFDITFLASQVYSDFKKKDGSNAGIVKDEFLTNRPNTIPSFAESYETTCETTGTVLYQTVSSLPAGYYQVGMYAAAMYTPDRGFTTEATEGDADRTFAFAGDLSDNSSILRTGAPISFNTVRDFDDLTTLDVNVHLSSAGDLTFGVQKDANGSNWHFAQVVSIVYSSTPDLTQLKATRDALVAEATGLKNGADAVYLTSDQQTALQSAIDAGEAADDFYELNTVTLTTLPNAINTAKQQIQQAKAAIPAMIAALERFENDYNLQDGTDYSRVTMSAGAWTDLLAKVNAVTTALDDISQASTYATKAKELTDQMDATDTSLRLFKSYKAMVEGTADLSIVGSYGADSNMDTDATQETAIEGMNTAFVNYANSQEDAFSVAGFLGSNLDFSAVEGTTIVTGNGNNICEVAGWEVAYANADQWAVVQTHQSNNDGKLYMRNNWSGQNPTLTVFKQKMLPVGKYRLSLSWNSDLANMTNLSQFKVGETTTAIGKNGNETLTYEFEVTDAPKTFDLQFGFRRTATGDAAAQIVVDDVTLTYFRDAIELADADDNATTIAANDGKTVNVTLAGRTLFKDGSWNTICLPFNMTAEQVAAQLAPSAYGIPSVCRLT